MTPGGTMRLPRPRHVNPLIWLGFLAAVVLATRPVWDLLLFGFEPSWDDLLALYETCLNGF